MFHVHASWHYDFDDVADEDKEYVRCEYVDDDEDDSDDVDDDKV